MRAFALVVALLLPSIQTAHADPYTQGEFYNVPLVVWDSTLQGWRDRNYIWPNETLGWSISDGLGHFWPLDQEVWRYRDGSLYVPPPPPPPPPPPAPVYYGSGVEQWRPLVASIFPSYVVDYVLSIMQCESGGNRWATGSQGEMGLMQIHPRWHADATYDPTGNILAAYRISGGGRDFSAWSCA